MTNVIVPRLSVLCVTPDSLTTLAQLFRALVAQSMAAELELVIVTPAAARDEALPFPPETFARITRVDAVAGTTPPEQRAQAVRAASAPYIVFTEDHCFPEPGWAAALVAALDAGAMAAGPIMTPGNSQNALARANYLLEYGPWSQPQSAGPARHLPGHNSAYRRDVLVALGDRLASTLALESPWLFEQTANGATVQCVAGARSHHFNFAVLGPSLKVRVLGGRVFGATRAHGWGPLKRVLWTGAYPLIVAIRWRRALEQARQFMAPQSLSFHLVLPVLLAADSLGEVSGYLFGVGTSVQTIGDLEYHRDRFTGGVPVVPPFLPSDGAV